MFSANGNFLFRRLLFWFALSLFQNSEPLPFNLALYDKHEDLNSTTENEEVAVLNKKNAEQGRPKRGALRLRGRSTFLHNTVSQKVQHRKKRPRVEACRH